MKKQLTCYLAGPEVFLPWAIDIGQAKKDLCKKYGFIGLFPFDNEVSINPSESRIDHLIYRANRQMMHDADIGIFNLTPFRGPSADVGTVFELGYMSALGKITRAYTNTLAEYYDRIAALGGLIKPDENGYPRDHENLMVENFGNSDNLMLDASLSVEKYGCEPNDHVGGFHRHAGCGILDDLTAFELCLKDLAG